MLLHRKIKFILHKRNNGATEFPVRMRVTMRGELPVDFSLGVRVSVAGWDNVQCRAKEIGTDEDKKRAREINRLIDDYSGAINEVFARYELLEKRKPSKEELKELLFDILGIKPIFEEHKHRVVDVWGEYVRERSKERNWSYASIKAHLSTKKFIVEFMGNMNISNVTADILVLFSVKLV